jgi:hypothetical protein
MTMKNEKISAAEAALAKIDARITTLETVERLAAQAFAADPTDALAKKMGDARTDLDRWKSGRVVALSVLEDARAEVVNSERADHAAKAQSYAARATRRAFRADVEPLASRLVSLRDEAERTRNAIFRVVEGQRHLVARAKEHAAKAGIDVSGTPFEFADAMAVVLARMSAGEHDEVGPLFRQVAESRDVATFVLRTLNLAPVLQPQDMSFADQVDRALDGEDIYATFRERELRSDCRVNTNPKATKEKNA